MSWNVIASWEGDELTQLGVGIKVVVTAGHFAGCEGVTIATGPGEREAVVAFSPDAAAEMGIVGTFRLRALQTVDRWNELKRGEGEDGR